MAGLNWAARQGRPDAAAAASVIASTFPNPTVSDAKMANSTIVRLKENEVTVKIWPIPEEDLRRLLIMDSAVDTSGQSRAQHGWIVGYTTPALAAGKEAPVFHGVLEVAQAAQKGFIIIVVRSIVGEKGDG